MWIGGALGGSTVDVAVPINVESGQAEINIDGSTWQKLSNGVTLQVGEEVKSAQQSAIQLNLQDNSLVRLDESSQLVLTKAEQKDDTYNFAMRLATGQIYVKSSDASATRTISSDQYVATIPNNAELVLRPREVKVLSASSDVALTINNQDFTLGEGQQLLIPEGVTDITSISSFRSPLDPSITASDFVIASRRGSLVVPGETGQVEVIQAGTLTLTAPNDEADIESETVVVQGSAQEAVDDVRINGYRAKLDPLTRLFREELKIESSPFLITIEALNENGVIIGREKRTVYHQFEEVVSSTGTDTETEPSIPVGAVTTPVITDPSAEGIFATEDDTLFIRGTTSSNTAAIEVNKYRLQLYKAGSTKWAYLADAELGTLKPGENTYTIVAYNAANQASEPVTITINYGGTTTQSSTSSAAPAPAANQTPSNPGSMQVVIPGATSPHTTDQTTLELRGSSASNTARVTVNGTDVTVNGTSWTYGLNTNTGNLKRGSNSYKIQSYDADGNLIDTLNYEVVLDLR
jgi:hypothetical protein